MKTIISAIPFLFSLRSNHWFAGLLSASFLLIPSLEAKTLKHKATGFRVKAPNGFRLRAFEGIYTIKRGGQSATVMRISSPMNKDGTARSLVNSGRLRRTRIKKNGGQITGTAGRNLVLIEIKGSGPEFDLSKFVIRRNALKRRIRGGRGLSLRDVASLRRIARSARGGIRSPLPIAVPMTPVLAGGVIAQVPNLPGWTFNAFRGGISGGRAGQGFYGFGLYFQGASFTPNPGQAIIDVWSRTSQGQLRVLDLAFIPGTEGYMGPNFFSGLYAAKVQIEGINYDVLIASGTTYTSGPGYDWFHSYAAVREGSFSGLGQALIQSWATRNTSIDNAARLNQAIQSLRSTPGLPIDDDVFQRADDAWVEYIRR